MAPPGHAGMLAKNWSSPHASWHGGAFAVNASKPIADLSGTVLRERYRLQVSIGAGGFATVYRAHDAHLGKVVAVKVLHPEHTKDIQDLERFRNEAAIAARIDDDFLVRVTDYGQDGQYFFFVMEHLVGQSLRDELRKHEGRPMAWMRAFKVADQVCSALEIAHAHDIIHRDVKPENIFITKRRNAEAIKLLDLGVAKILQDQYWSGLQKNLSRTNQIIGSPCYISPEQIQGAKACDARIDIYSLGVVLYELVTGTVPFRGSNVWETMYQHVNVKPIAPTARASGITLPAPLEAIILRALEKDPRDRFRTIREMGTSIRFELEQLRSDRQLARSVRMMPALAMQEKGSPPPVAREEGNSGPEGSEKGSGIADSSIAVAPAASLANEARSASVLQALPKAFHVVSHSDPFAGIRSPAPEEAEVTPGRQPRGDDLASPSLPLSGATKVMLGVLVAASLTVTCSVGTVLAMTLDTSWIDRRLRTSVKSDAEITDEDGAGGPISSPRVAELASAAPGNGHEFATTRIQATAPEEAAQIEPAVAPSPVDEPRRVAAGQGRGGAKAEARAKGSGTSRPRGSPAPDDDLLPVAQSMRAIARRAGPEIKRSCRISFLSSLEQAEYQVVFHVDTSSGTISRVEPGGPLIPFENDRCVENLAKSIIGSFQGASDLQPRFVHGYSVSRQG